MEQMYFTLPRDLICIDFQVILEPTHCGAELSNRGIAIPLRSSSFCLH